MVLIIPLNPLYYSQYFFGYDQLGAHTYKARPKKLLTEPSSIHLFLIIAQTYI